MRKVTIILQTLYSISFGCFILSALFTADICAQQQIQRNANLASLVGFWSGAVEMDGNSYPCERNCRWILSGAFIQSEMKIYRDNQRKETLVETIEISSPAGVNRFALYRFDSDGISQWGTKGGAGTTWECTLDYSNGYKEIGIFEWVNANMYEYRSTIHNEDGEIVRKVLLTMKKQK